MPTLHPPFPDANLDAFTAALPQLLRRREGCYAAVTNGQVVAVRKGFAEALAAGLRAAHGKTLLVQQIVAAEMLQKV